MGGGLALIFNNNYYYVIVFFAVNSTREGWDTIHKRVSVTLSLSHNAIFCLVSLLWFRWR